MSKKKTLALISGMVLLLAASIIGYLLVDRSKQQEEDAVRAEQASLQLISFNTDYVQTVEIDLPGEGHFEIGTRDGQWTLLDTDYPHAFTLSPYYITTVVNYMSDLQALQKITIEPERLGAYGLDDPVTVSCTIGSETYTACFGNPSVTEECWYAKLPDSDLVYGIDYNRGAVLHSGMEYLKNRTFLEYYDVDIVEFQLLKDNRLMFDLSKASGLWEMAIPKLGVRTDTAQVNWMFTSLTRFEVERFVEYAEDAETLKRLGLDKPAYTMIVRTASEETRLLFAPVPDGDGTMYMLNDETRQVSVISKGAAEILELKAEEFIIKQLLDRPFQEAKRLEVKVDDLHFTMDIDAMNGVYKLDGRDLSGQDENVIRLFRNLYDTVAGLAAEDVDMTASPVLEEDTEAPCEFRYTMQDGTETVLTLLPATEENVYYTFVDGAYTGTTLRRRALTSNTGVINFHEKLMDAIKS